MFTIKPNIKTKWYDFRGWLSRGLIWLARKIKPDCPYNYTYFMEEMMKVQLDNMTYGKSAFKIEHQPIDKVEVDNG